MSREHSGDGGPYGQASLLGPRAVAVGPDGALYICEREGNGVRRVDLASGLIDRFAGTGAKGYSGDGGPAIDATFNEPYAVVIDGDNNLYIADRLNAVVRKVDGKTRIISTLAGTGTINGNVINGHGTVSPGHAPAILTINGTYTQTQYATLMIQIAGTSPGQFSVLDVTGNANLNAFLDPVLLNGYVSAIGDYFTFLNYASLTGGFSHIKHQVFDNGLLQWSVIYQNNSAILTVVPNTIPDQGSTLLLLTLGLLALVTYRRQLSTGIGCARRRKCPLIRK